MHHLASLPTTIDEEELINLRDSGKWDDFKNYTRTYGVRPALRWSA